MKNLIVAGIVLILLLLSLVGSKKNKKTADHYLILYLGFALLTQAYFYFETAGMFQHSYAMLLGRGVYLLHAPLLFLYVYVLLTSKKVSASLAAVLFLPFVLYVLHSFYFYVWVFDSAAVSIQNGLLAVDGATSISWALFAVLFLLIEPVYVGWFYLLLSRYKKGLLDNVSQIDPGRLRWLYLLFYLWLITTVVLAPLSALSVGMSNEMVERLKQNQFPHAYEHQANDGNHSEVFDHFDTIYSFLDRHFPAQ